MVAVAVDMFLCQRKWASDEDGLRNSSVAEVVMNGIGTWKVHGGLSRPTDGIQTDAEKASKIRESSCYRNENGGNDSFATIVGA